MTGTAARIIQGNALALPLADASVDLVVTSPPYFGLRSYQDGGQHYAGQIGSEATPAEFVDALIAATREMVRVLKPAGSIWVNLGDKYAGGGMGGHSSGLVGTKPQGEGNGYRRVRLDIPTKSLIGIPWRYALRCIDDLSLILRAEIIWSKPNGLPESVTDRVRRSHETWFHFTVQPRYFSAVDEIREPAIYPEDMRHLRGGRRSINPDGSPGGGNTTTCNPLGKLPGSVWTVATQPLTVPAELGIDHFAAFPMEWPRRIIQGWSPAGVCSACGEGRRPVVHKGVADFAGYRASNGHRQAGNSVSDAAAGMDRAGAPVFSTTATITGYACACPEPTATTLPSVVLDPFGGTGTTALMAKALGRTGISVDMSADYCRLATWRTTDPGQMAAALQIEKPEPISPDQLDLFGEVVA
jgi:DNA modification methylase